MNSHVVEETEDEKIQRQTMADSIIPSSLKSTPASSSTPSATENDSSQPLLLAAKTKQHAAMEQNAKAKPHEKNPSIAIDEEMAPEIRRTSESNDVADKFVITVEPLMFLVILGSNLMEVTIESLLIYKLCLVSYGYPEDVCNNLTANATLNHEIQKVAANYGLYRSLIETLPSFVFSLFLGPWSDKHGRKFPIVFPIFGYLFALLGYVVNSYYIDLAPEYLFVCSITIGLTGGMVICTLGLFSYITDVSSPQTRTKRIGIVQAAMFTAMPLGLIASGQIHKSWGFVPVFSCGACSFALAILYFYLRGIKETVDLNGAGQRNKFYDMFNVRNIKETVAIVFRKRDGRLRLYLSLLIFSMCTILLPFAGELALGFLFARQKFKWDQAEYTYYAAATQLTGALAIFLLIPVLGKRSADSAIGIVGNIGRIVGCLLIQVYNVGGLMYITCVLSMLQPLLMSSVGSLMTKLIDKDERGKVFALLGSCEVAVPLLGNLFYSQMYNATSAAVPGSIYLLSAGILVVPTAILCFVYIDMRKTRPKVTYESYNSIEAVANS